MKLRRRTQAGLVMVMMVVLGVVEIAVMVADVQVAIHSGLSIRQALWAERPWLQVGEEETHAASIDALASQTGMRIAEERMIGREARIRIDESEWTGAGGNNGWWEWVSAQMLACVGWDGYLGAASQDGAPRIVRDEVQQCWLWWWWMGLRLWWWRRRQ
jgi:hypothetical protein